MKRLAARLRAVVVASVLSLMGAYAFGQPPPVPNDCWYAHHDDPEAYEECLERELARTRAAIRLAACELPYVSYLCTGSDVVDAAKSCESGKVYHNGGCVVPTPCGYGQVRTSAGVCVCMPDHYWDSSTGGCKGIDRPRVPPEPNTIPVPNVPVCTNDGCSRDDDQ